MKTTDLNSKIKAALESGNKVFLNRVFGLPYPLDVKQPDPLCLFSYARRIYMAQSEENRKVLLIAADIADEMDLHNTVLSDIWPKLTCVNNIVNYYCRSVKNFICRYCGSKMVTVFDDEESKYKTVRKDRGQKLKNIVRSTISLDKTISCSEDGVEIKLYDITPSASSAESLLLKHETDALVEEGLTHIRNCQHRYLLRVIYETAGELTSAQLSGELSKEGIVLSKSNIDTIKSRASSILKAYYYKTFSQ